ncbi:MAG TPA: DNA-directed RNA polymerase subunit beta' [Candidatus Paceibacterota bacterium]|jgi:DNA-directed RNA polymerase subunit beta'|nr:DNA-directed RNA polymerase subunit beta' [Candidatus Paceibacterota bacterium]HQO70879.1 DNA-directed RNA polymerase subunit beta' [Candidatus Paceibacterota bacterium]HQQ21791.1 DNA-directed RNA polymerase subunit beta' [Candidatus Paceibacterota bacterium]
MKTFDTTNFNAISLKLASPEAIREWSFGEVTKPETINYRTGRSERNGLFDERIFGPEKDYECYCGKYRRIRYKDIICEKCGVQVTRSIVRRERMGHIELASPVAHIWFLRGVPSRMSILLGVSISDLEKVIYFAGYIITKIYPEEKETIIKNLESEFKSKIKATEKEEDKEKLKELLLNAKREINEIVPGKVLNEIAYHHFGLKYGSCFEASIGAEAIFSLFKEMDLKAIEKEAEKSLEKASSVEKEKLEKKLSLVRSMIRSNLRPEWMFLTAIPVIPPALRPMVALDGGRHATSDLNDLYRRVINRNNRLKKLMEIGAPDVILRNEKRILQEAVDALIDNSIAKQNDSQAVSSSQKRALKSLSDNLKSKQGLFRQNLLGKRVDYSGRSVIVIGPKLKLNECGLPKHMALELFRPFVISKILETELAFNIRGANRLIEEGVPEVWAILEEVIQGKYVLLNRAPTLHRLGIQAFNPVLVEGNAVQIHPLICAGFNADFDGDQMAVYLPLSTKAQSESRDYIASNKNLLNPQNGSPIVYPKLDIVLGCYWMTKSISGEKGEGMIFASPNQAITAFDLGVISLRAKIKVYGGDSERYKSFGQEPFETTVGKLFFNSIFPDDFNYVGEEITVKRMTLLVEELIARYGIDLTPPILDKIKDFGFRYSTYSGVTWSIDNVCVPKEKESIVKDHKEQEKKVKDQYEDGLLSDDEKRQKVIEIWEHARKEIEKAIPNALEENGPTRNLIDSGARGNTSQLTQMCGMKGIITNTAGEQLDFPIIPSYIEGLTPLEYFVTTHGARKGTADTALNTAKAGYLTRRLVDVAQDVVVTEEDCGTKKGKKVVAVDGSFAKYIFGRILAEDIKDKDGKVLFKRGDLINKEDSIFLEKEGITEAIVRTPLTCETTHGVCQKCYGLDLGRNQLIDIGQAVGIIAAQAIGEPGTQLTLRTFHAGGVANVDITTGLPRVEEIFERRTPKSPAIISASDGEVVDITENSRERIVKVLSDLKVDNKAGGKKGNEVEYSIPLKHQIFVKIGDHIKKGQIMTDGSADIREIVKYGGKEAAEDYIVSEVNKVYDLQSASISRKHPEIIIRQMFSRKKIKNPGDSSFSPGEIVENVELVEENERIEKEGGKKAEGATIVLGISEVALTTKSWLSAASFQNTNRVLISSAVQGGVDELRGLKENVIIGGLIPAGSGFGVPRKTKEDNDEEIKEENWADN